jgi:hypothetical protein
MGGTFLVSAEVKKIGLEDGNFMVRSRAAGKPGYVMCVVYKSNPTHHLMVPNEDGFMTINKKTYGGAKTLEQVSGKFHGYCCCRLLRSTTVVPARSIRLTRAWHSNAALARPCPSK